MKKFTTLFLVFILALALFLPMGCENYEKKFYTLDEVYENGEITRQNLLSIIYYINGGIIEENKEQYPEDFVPTPKDPEELDENTERAIENAYNNQLKKENKKLYADVIIEEVRYYGTYNDYICVGIRIEIPGVSFGDVVFQETIDGVSYWRTPTFNVFLYKE
ncbi:MAG: hypothetical protein J6Z34_04340 [Clostridia bacterium]|nr:hypothetical protein [Clostridia bacterium]